MRRGDVFVIPITFPEGLNVLEMAKIFESKGFGAAESFVEAARSLEGYLFPNTYALSRHTDASKLVQLMNDAFERALTPDIARPPRRRGASRSAARDAGVDRREGNRQSGGAAAGRVGLREPAADRHGAAVRPDGDLRARTRGTLRRQHAGATI